MSAGNVRASDNPHPISLMRFAPLKPARGSMFGAAERIARGGDQEPVVREEELYGLWAPPGYFGAGKVFAIVSPIPILVLKSRQYPKWISIVDFDTSTAIACRGQFNSNSSPEIRNGRR